MHTTSSRPIPTRRHNPCQICGDIKGKCREAGDLLLCMNITDAYSAPSEFKFLGLTKNSLWGKFVVCNKQGISFEERSERRRQREATKKAEQEARAKTALSLSERDQATRMLHKHLGLSTKHRQELRNRGLSDATIDAGYFFSVAPGDDLTFGIPANYPGAKNGKLSVAGTGFACPAWSVNGEVIGWQLRLDDATDNKYRWAKGNVSSHLANGELPITVVRPSELKHQWLAEAEGILKPYITAQKLGAVCIGAAGGNITASPEQFKQAIASLGVNEIRDFPDAGDVRNAQVMHRLIAKYEFYRSLGLEIKIGWWDQITKDQDDIDELATLDGIEYISVDEFLVIARQHGFKLSVRQTVQRRDEPDAKAYDEYLKREAELEQFEAGLDHYLNGKRLENFLGKTLKQIKKFVSQAPKHLGVKGFEEKAAPVTSDSVIWFKKGDREKIISQIALQAKKDGRRAIILDSSEPGTGKSHNWGEMSNGVLGVDKLFYTNVGHRNPSVSPVESNFVDLPVRNDGLFEDESKQTSLGSNHIRWAKTNEGEKPNVKGNCSRTQEFHVWDNKGYHAETSVSASINSICKTCEFALGCAGVKDENGNLIMQPAPGNTYRSDRQEALTHPKIRCSLDSLPTIEALKEGDEQEGKEPQRVAIIVDEFHQQFRATNLTQVELTELDSTWAYFETRHLALQQEIQQIKSLVQQKRDDLETLEDKEQIRASAENIISLMRDLDTTQKLIQRLPGVLDAVRPIVHTLRLVIAGDLPTTQQTYHGWNENLLREEIGKLPEELTEAIEVLSVLNPKLSSLLDGTEADSVSQRGVEGSTKQKKESSATLKYIRKAFEKEAKQEAKDRLKSVPANWVVPVLKILNGSRGSFRVKNGTLEVVTPNHRHKEQILAADLAVVLDATLSREELAENLEIDPFEIILIQQERQSYENLTVLQVVGMGKLTKNRSSELNSRLDALLEELDKKHPSKAVIDHLAVKRQGDGHWFADSRATNAYQDKTALITVGSPYMDIGSLAMVYSTMTGDKNAVKGNPRFDKFVQRFKESEMIQAGGRLRVHRRKEEQLFWYVVSDEDIGYLKSAFPGATFEEVSALSITPLAASESERTFSAIMQAIAQLAEEKVEQEKFEKLNQTEIALRAGIAQGTVSKRFCKSKNELIAKVGGWTGFKKIFQALVSFYRDWNNFSKSLVEQLGEDAAHIAQTYLPQFLKENQHDIEAIASECVNMAQIVGWRAIQVFLHLMPHESRVNMLISLMEQLSEDWRMQFLEVWKCKLTLEAWVS